MRLYEDAYVNEYGFVVQIVMRFKKREEKLDMRPQHTLRNDWVIPK